MPPDTGKMWQDTGNMRQLPVICTPPQNAQKIKKKWNFLEKNEKKWKKCAPKKNLQNLQKYW